MFKSLQQISNTVPLKTDMCKLKSKVPLTESWSVTVPLNIKSGMLWALHKSKESQ